jgi:hypothetical protein
VTAGAVGRWPVVGILVLLVPCSGWARGRPLFEPTDLEMEEPGVVEVDLQFGPVHADAWKLVVPDAEIDVGLFPALELDIDGAYAIEGADGRRFTLDHPAPDNLWVAAKVGIADWHAGSRATAVGAQVGPKLPVARDAHAVGAEGLLLVSEVWGESHVVLNLGALVDPRIMAERPRGFEGGIDLALSLGPKGWSLTSELGGVHFFSHDANQLHATAGVAWSPTDSLELSVVGLVGLLSGGDRLGLLFGISPKFALWR